MFSPTHARCDLTPVIAPRARRASPPSVRPDLLALWAAQGTSCWLGVGDSLPPIIPRVLQQKMRQNASVIPH